MKKDFETSTKAPAKTACVNAINFVMDNVFDWNSHNEHDGLRFTREDCINLSRSLKKNLRATCPDVDGTELLEHYHDMLYNNWAGQFSDIKKLTRSVIKAFMEAEVGNQEPMKTLTRKLGNLIKGMEKHYPEVTHAQDVPVHMLVDAMESKEDNARSEVESKTAIIQQISEAVSTGTAADIAQVRKKRPGIFSLTRR